MVVVVVMVVAGAAAAGVGVGVIVVIVVVVVVDVIVIIHTTLLQIIDDGIASSCIQCMGSGRNVFFQKWLKIVFIWEPATYSLLLARTAD